MHRTTRLNVTDINQHFICVLCDGYLIDATTIIECLHSFCRTCIVRYLENCRFCPVCDVQVHKTKPLQSIRSDTTLQDVVYKLIPGLYQNEMQRRREFYGEHPEAAAKCSTEEKGEGAEQRCFYSPKENISLTLEYFKGSSSYLDSESTPDEPDKDMMTRHLNCPAALTVAHLKKFIRMKFSLPLSYTVKIMYNEHLLLDTYTLIDIAYIYSWRRAGPMKFYYTFCNQKSVVKRQITPTAEPAKKNVDLKRESEEVNETTTIPVVSEDSVDNNSENLIVPSAAPEKMETSDSSSNKDAVCAPSDETKPDETPLSSESSVSEPQKIIDNEAAEVPNSIASASPNETLISTTTVELAPQPTVKVVPSQSTVVSATNGIKLKLIHCPEPATKARSKKERKGGRSRYKSAPVQQRFPRLAPYPPPHQTASTACMASPMSQLAMSKLVPTVMSSLSPNIMTALVPTTANSLCNVTKNTTVLPHASFLSQSSHVVTCNVTTQQITHHATTHSNSYGTVSKCIPATSLRVSSSTAKLNPSAPASPCPSYMNGLPTTHVITIPTVPNPCNIQPQVSTTLPNVVGSGFTFHPATSQASVLPVTFSGSLTAASYSVPSAIQPKISEKTGGSSPIPMSSSTIPSASESRALAKTVVATDHPIATMVEPTVTPPVSKMVETVKCPEKPVSKTPEPCISTLQTILCSDQITNGVKSSPKIPTATPEGRVECNGNTASPAPVKESFCDKFSADKKTSKAFEMSVKNSISAEFSDNDDLGCQPDLVVDEQKMDSSDNEDDTDAALRKKITAIAEKEDEADVTDDTEADSGRASDISSQARSSCDDDIGSPMNSIPTSDTVTISASACLPTFSLAVSSPTPTLSDSRTVKSNKINLVIDNILKSHEKKDSMGALDLSTCTKKPGEGSSRHKPVANPVLDIKHRQQTYLPAPNNKQHTACVPSPKHPTSSPILMHGLTSHHSNLTPTQISSIHNKSPHLPVPPFHATAMVYPSQNRNISSPSLVPGRSTPTYNSSHSMSPPVPTAHQSLSPLLSGMIPRMSVPVMPSYPIRSATPSPSAMPTRNFSPTLAIHLKALSSPPPTSNNLNRISSPSQNNSNNLKRISSPPQNNSNNLKLISSPPQNNSNNLKRISSPPQNSNPAKRMASSSSSSSSPQNPSAMPVRNFSPASHVKGLTSPPLSAYIKATHKSNQPTISTYKKSNSSAHPTSPNHKKTNSYKSYNYKFKGSNLAVINPDPNGYQHKLVIRNLDVRPNSNQQSQKL